MLKYKILLVDDDSLILEALSDALESQGYYVKTADNGSDAIKIIKKSEMDIVITDLVMDEVDGIKVLKEAKAKNPDIRVMILTGYGDLSSAIDVLRLEADDYILKPCSDDELFFRVSKCVEKIETHKKVKLYEKILPVCCICKKIRDDSGKERGKGIWMWVDDYLTRRAKISITSSYCPECAETLKEEISRSCE